LDAVLLAAGYATRLYPLTEDFPKPLLEVGGRPIVDYVAEELDASADVERMLLVTNERFAGAFRDWARAREFSKPLEILTDGSTCNDDRLGAIGDFGLAIREAGAGAGSAYLLATDNLARFSLLDVLRLWRTRGANAVYACPTDPDRLRRVGVAVLDDEDRVVQFEEKPEHPKGNLRVPPFYVYTPEAVGLVGRYLSEGNNPDAPGHFLAWLVGRQPVYALRRPEGTWDIGTLEAYRAACREFDERRRRPPGAAGSSRPP
jgi:glucose-1-phosphate thymidylyltransferase